MDSNRFDTWTRTRAPTTNRRSLLGWSLTAGLGAALTRLHPAAAQFDGDQAGSCTWSVSLTSSLDGQTASGTLAVDIGDDGAIESGSLILNGRSSSSVVGQATGPAVDLLISLADGSLLSLTGVGGSRIDACADRITGFLANPGTGQLGTWRAVSGSGGGSGSTAPPPTSGQSSGSDSGGNSGDGGNGGGSGGGDDNGGDGSCLELHSQCNASAECCSGWCSDNECRTCGNTICGEDCIVLSDNLAHCGTCFNPCDTETQTCIDGMCSQLEPLCLPFGGLCGANTECCSGFCNAGVCFEVDRCPGSMPATCPNISGCVDLGSDNGNCGLCNNPCYTGFCRGGICVLE